ncbi:MAG: ABC transporter permease [Deltaproteobacteria bacterium]|nr:ABC transporter permease [Deltaproteobacteria bacterium]
MGGLTMFSLDRWQEIFSTLRAHKLRTALTSLSVAWGIFMLVLLLGAGRGLSNGVQDDFKDDAVNSLWIFGGRSSVAFKGLAPGRETRMRNADYERLRTNQAGVEHITSRFRVGDPMVSFRDKTSAFDIRATHPDHVYLEMTQMLDGRFINQRDLDEKRKVTAIGVGVRDFLFGETNPLGEYIAIGGMNYRIVGVFSDEGGEGEEQKLYIPITTAQATHGASDRAHRIMFTVDEATTVEESEAIEEEVRQAFAARHEFDPTDRQALRIRNNVEAFSRIQQVFSVLEIFVWFISAGTIIAGIVGVSNIMLISVKERTKEIGVRKALGATPGSIVAMVVQEAVFITAIAGYLGLVAGVLALEGVASAMPDNQWLANPSVDFRVAINATVLLIVCGALAGFFPARRAARVSPIVALRDE